MGEHGLSCLCVLGRFGNCPSPAGSCRWLSEPWRKSPVHLRTFTWLYFQDDIMTSVSPELMMWVPKVSCNDVVVHVVGLFVACAGQVYRPVHTHLSFPRKG